MIPEGWAKSSVSWVTSGLDAGVSVNSNGTPALAPQFGILKTSCVSGGRFDPRENKLVAVEIEIERLRQPVTKNTIIISRMNTPALVGANAYVPVSFPNLFLPDRLWALKVRDDRVQCLWLSYWFHSKPIRNRISSIATGTSGSMKNVTKPDIRSLKLQLPPLPEQKKIAEILSTWDRAIEVSEKLLENATSQKRALMQKLLTGKRRFTEFEGEEWREVKFGDAVKLSKEKFDPRLTKTNNRCVELEHMQQGTGQILGHTDSSSLSSIKSVFHPGDVLFGKLRPYLRKFSAPQFSGICSTEIWVLKPDQNILTTKYLHFMVQTDGFMEEANRSAGSKMPRSDWKIVSDYHVRIPSFLEQHAITNVLDYCASRVDTLTTDILNLQSEKKALMQQLLTGKKRVKV